MPTRIKAGRPGYGNRLDLPTPPPAQPDDPPDGYYCIGILRPCIEPMLGTEFDCLPKSVQGQITNTPYDDLTDLKTDGPLQTAIATCNDAYDPLNGGVFIDLWGALKRKGLDSGISTGCSYPYLSNDTIPSGPNDFPIEAESSLQVQYDPGYLEPPIVILPRGGEGSAQEHETVTVVTDIRLSGSGASLQLEMQKRDMQVLDPTVAAWEPVPGWEVTLCPT